MLYNLYHTISKNITKYSTLCSLISYIIMLSIITYWVYQVIFGKSWILCHISVSVSCFIWCYGRRFSSSISFLYDFCGNIRNYLGDWMKPWDISTHGYASIHIYFQSYCQIVAIVAYLNPQQYFLRNWIALREASNAYTTTPRHL